MAVALGIAALEVSVSRRRHVTFDLSLTRGLPSDMRHGRLHDPLLQDQGRQELTDEEPAPDARRRCLRQHSALWVTIEAGCCCALEAECVTMNQTLLVSNKAQSVCPRQVVFVKVGRPVSLWTRGGKQTHTLLPLHFFLLVYTSPDQLLPVCVISLVHSIASLKPKCATWNPIRAEQRPRRRRPVHTLDSGGLGF